MYMKYNKMMRACVVFVFICASLYFVNVDCGNEKESLDYASNCLQGQLLEGESGCTSGEFHFKNGWSYLEQSVGSETESELLCIKTPGLFVDKRELGRPWPLMKIGKDWSDEGGAVHLLGAGDPLRYDDGLQGALYLFSICKYGNEEALKGFRKLAARGGVISHGYKIGVGLGANFLTITKFPLDLPPSPQLHTVNLASDGVGEALAAFVEGRAARFDALNAALADWMSADLVTLLVEFDENSPKELRTIKERNSQMRQKGKEIEQEQKVLARRLSIRQGMRRAATVIGIAGIGVGVYLVSKKWKK